MADRVTQVGVGLVLGEGTECAGDVLEGEDDVDEVLDAVGDGGVPGGSVEPVTVDGEGGLSVYLTELPSPTNHNDIP